MQAIEKQHAKLSPSSAARWMACPASVRLEADLPDESTTFAREGTAAHELADKCLRGDLMAEHYLGTTIIAEGEEFVVGHEMADNVQIYLDYVRNLGGELFPEQTVDFSHVVPDGFGTSDAIVFKDDTLHVIDLKYGKGVRVDADNNPQAMLYAVGALNEYGMIFDNIKSVVLTIVQPRLDHISEYPMTPDELNTFADDARKAAKAALAKKAKANPDEKACRFCKARGICRALAEHAYKTVAGEFADFEEATPVSPETLTNTELAQVLGNLDAIKAWVSSVEATAQSKLEQGEELPGYKLVEGRSLRKWDDDEATQTALLEAGAELSIITKTTLLSPAQIEKVLGKKHPVLLAHSIKPQGKPTIAKASDKRPALDTQPIEQDFADI